MSNASGFCPTGFSEERLARIPRFLEAQVAAGALPGALTLIWRDGRVAHQSLVGAADPGRGIAMREDAIFRLYSMTKPVTAVALLMLLEAGKVALDDPVAKFIPGFAGLKPQVRPMTVLDLLRHTAGLTYGFQQRSNVDAAYRAAKIGEVEKAGTLDSMIADLAKIPLECSPGEAWNYSVSTDVLGYLIGKISGMPFEQFLKERIFGPLGMNDTDFHVPASKAHRFAACYSADPPGQLTFGAVERKGGLTLQDDPTTSSFLSRLRWFPAAAGCARPRPTTSPSAVR